MHTCHTYVYTYALVVYVAYCIHLKCMGYLLFNSLRKHRIMQLYIVMHCVNTAHDVTDMPCEFPRIVIQGMIKAPNPRAL